MNSFNFIPRPSSTALIFLLFLTLTPRCFTQPSLSRAGPNKQVQAEIDRCGGVIDVHLHTGAWFNKTSFGQLVSEMNMSGISRGLLFSVYGRRSNPFGGDPNEDVHSIAHNSKGRIFGIASLNTTTNWEAEKQTELLRLKSSLEKPEFVGAKMAPALTCLSLDSDILQEVINAISKSPKPIVLMHTGTTPMCGPFGDMVLGYRGCCSREYVDPLYLDQIIGEYSNVTFVLLHAGQDFLEPTSINYYNNTLVDNAIQVAKRHDNVYLELSAFLRTDAGGNFVNSHAQTTMKKIVSADLAGRCIYGSDVNHFPGSLLPYLTGAISAMIKCGFSEEERCTVLSGNALKLFGLKEQTATNPSIIVNDDEEVGANNDNKTKNGTLNKSPPSNPTSSASSSFQLSWFLDKVFVMILCSLLLAASSL